MNSLIEVFSDFVYSPLGTGCMMLMMNLGSRYIVLETPKGMEVFFSHPWTRKFMVFLIVFVATRNFKTSLLLFLLFILFSKYLLNENSKNCLSIVKEKIKIVSDENNSVRSYK
jgi:hypothetical protein